MEMEKKMNKVNYITSSNGTVSLFVFSQNKLVNVVIDASHPNHRKVVSLLKSRPSWTDEEVARLLSLADMPTAVAKSAETFVTSAVKNPKSLVGTAEVRDGQVYVNNVPVHNVISDRIVQFVSQGLPVDPILRFLELLLENPSSRAQQELYDFLANRSLPLTEDGHFLAYKRVREDWMDIYTGRIDNSIGKIVEVKREQVDDDRRHECSYGLHVGALEYVRGYGHGGHVVIVKVNPRDCISVPLDHSAQKLRVCRYEVLYKHDETKFLEKSLYTTKGAETSAKDWLDSEREESVSERYWEEDWNDDVEEGYTSECENGCMCDTEEAESNDDAVESYKNWALDSLAYEAQSRGLIKTRQEGRDMGKAELAMLLAEDDLN